MDDCWKRFYGGVLQITIPNWNNEFGDGYIIKHAFHLLYIHHVLSSNFPAECIGRREYHSIGFSTKYGMIIMVKTGH